MTQEEIDKWIKRNQDAIDQNLALIKQAEKEIEFSKKVIDEIYKLSQKGII